MRGNARPHLGPRAAAASGLVLILLCPAAARAQLLQRFYPENVPAYQDWTQKFVSLTPQPDPAYQPLGVNLGSFTIDPYVQQTAGYDSNPLAARRAVGSAIFETDAGASAHSNWARDALYADVSLAYADYPSIPSATFTDWTAALGGRIDHGTNGAELGYTHIHSLLLPAEFGTAGLAAPAPSDIDEFRVSDAYGGGRLLIEPAFDAALYRFGNGSGGTAQGLFDRDAIGGSLTADYRLGSGLRLLLVGRDTGVTYPGGGAGRPADYNDAAGLFGAAGEVPGLFAWRLLAGYEARSSSGTLRGHRDAIAAEGDVIWAPTRLVSVTAILSRSFLDEPSGFAQGLIGTTATLRADYAILRNVTLGAEAGVVAADGSGAQGSQTRAQAGARARWQLNRRVSLSSDYSYTDLSGSGALQQSTSRHQVTISLRLTL